MIFNVEQPTALVAALASRVDRILTLPRRIRRAIRGYATARRFRSHGSNFNFDPDGTYTYENITIGRDVNLGAGATLVATRSLIEVGNHVMFGPDVTVRGGNHRFDVVGRFIDTIKDDEKRREDDPGVVIQDDVWVGTGTIILGGVTIGRGSVIGAGSVVTKSVPPYSIVGGNPARVIRARFDADQIVEHEAALYEVPRRLNSRANS